MSSSLYHQRIPFVLASGSPRRSELLSLCGLKFGVAVSDTDETPLAEEGPEELVSRLAELKTKDVAGFHSGVEDWFLGADTVVAKEKTILGKPTCAKDAESMLTMLSASEHEVWGGVSLFQKSTGQVYVRSSVTKVRLSALGSGTIRRYIESGEPMDKAGAYGIQGLASPFVESIDGSYSNVVGLNLALVISLFQEVGILQGEAG